MSLRPYQRDALASTMARFDSGQQRVAGVAATGAGKTVIFSAVIQEWKRRNPGAPVMVLAHRSELLSQAAEKVRLWAPGLRVGLVQAGVNQVWADVIVASQQTLQRQSRLERLPGFDRRSLIVVDECHRSMSDSYQKVLAGLGALDPDGPRILGVTATFTREDSRRLTDFYQSVAFNVDILDLIEMGYLVPPKFRRVLVEGLDLTAVRSARMAGGKDLAAGDLDAAMERAGAAGVVAAAYRLHAPRDQGMVFTPTVHSAEQVRDALRAEGITSEVLSGATPSGERARVMREYNAGRLQTITNCALLTEGVDAPRTRVILMARPTLSKILFRQIVGRGLRLFCPANPRDHERCPECKTDCLVLDMVGATGRNDLRTLNDIADRPLDVREGELVTDAVKRAAQSVARSELIGDAMVSGSLAVADVDPWEVERRAKMTARERAAEDGAGDEAEEDSSSEPEPPSQKLRYAHVPGRSGWFLRSNRDGVWFIPCQPNRMQTGFVCVVPDRGRFHVAVQLPGIDWRQHLVELESEDDAAQLALDLTLGILPGAEQRAQIDPDARWRRRPATKAQLRLLALVGGEGSDDVQYQGQAGDLITLAKMSGPVENFARNVAASLATVLA